MLKKLVSKNKQTLIKKLDDTVLPLFQNEYRSQKKYTLHKACIILQSQTQRYIENLQCDKTKKQFLNSLTTYFDLIKHKKLYAKGYETEIHPLLIKVARLINTLKDNNEILQLFISAINDRQCLDEHRAQLKRILNNQLLN